MKLDTKFLLLRLINDKWVNVTEMISTIKEENFFKNSSILKKYPDAIRISYTLPRYGYTVEAKVIEPYINFYFHENYGPNDPKGKSSSKEIIDNIKLKKTRMTWDKNKAVFIKEK